MTAPHPDHPLIPPPPPRGGLFASLRGSFLTGLVVILPVAVTFWLIWSLMGWIDSWVLPMIPEAYRPEQYIGINLRGVGVIIFLIFTVVIGWAAKGLIGRSLLRLAEGVVHRTPIVRSIYGGVKQIAETVLSTNDARFDRACLINYPSPGIRSIAFVAGSPKGEIAARHDQPMLAVFMPTTPNPTSGFLMYVPENEVEILDMSVEDAAKLIISAGLVYPPAGPDPVGIDAGNSDDRSTVS